ncbi:hypothetical protein EN851_25055 [Mesorhizobium sp. M8A.F.Ca.ET.208.01.1.1]|uniref:hypothetical protein n=1 Tax=unclassified Mesorhizobium TaxID=325217 RepID=UPI00109414E1|nr:MULTISPECIES: hypothetical protein [unclassified Mesorhizobium]TGQ88816.1 hypothetical protein EN851_25055 [Mesorhizobium sp. M8A.F.Ca.ET.208.01.1.1]TGT50103.1 hypothetical protein EN810_24955 [Mesorhizobium sp. M8A.F.Ca.ET.167.01.1.1]
MANPTVAYRLTLCLYLLSTGAFAAEHCQGQAPLTHDLGVENFLTTSRVYRGNGVEIYETCVENRGAGDLWVNWLVPGPTTWLPPGTAVAQPRPFIERNTIDASGCLEYGNIGATIRERFIGHASDADALKKEEAAGCAAAISASSHVAGQTAPQEIAAPIRLFVPSDKHNPSSTMLEFTALATASSSGAAQPYKLGIAYSLSPLEGRSAGNPNTMTIRLSPGYLTGWLMDKTESTDIFKGVTLGYKNEIGLQLLLNEKPQLRSARYEILDQNNELVGAFMAPTWGPP